MAIEASILNEADAIASMESPPKMRSAEKKPHEVKVEQIITKTDFSETNKEKPSAKRPRRRQSSVSNKREPKTKKSTKSLKRPPSSNSESDNSVLITVYVDSSCPSEANSSCALASNEITESNEINKDNEMLQNDLQVVENTGSLLKPEPVHQDGNQVATSSKIFAENAEISGIDLDSSAQNKKSTELKPYYRRKTFGKEKKQGFQIDALLGEWNDSDSEHLGSQKQVNKDLQPESNELKEIDDTASEISVISVTSETSESSVAFVVDLHFENASKN